MLNADGNPAATTITSIPSEAAGTKRFRLTGTTERPALVRLRYQDGTVSTFAIIALADVLRQSTKESRGRKAEEAAAQLAEETNEGFWLLETLDILEAAEKRQHDDAKTITRKRLDKDKPKLAEQQHHTLDYERFIAGRHLRSDQSTFSPNSLAGSELSLVRGFLNPILGIAGQDDTPAELPDGDDLNNAFSMGDETADAKGAIEGGEEFPEHSPGRDHTDKGKHKDDSEKEKIERLKRERRKAHTDQIIAAIGSFKERIDTRAAAGQLGTIDVLRLRVLIVVVVAAGWGGIGAASNVSRTSSQVFASSGGVSWPRLLGRILFIFFGGSKPAIRDLRLEASFNELTEDVQESWASCFWATQVAFDAVCRCRENAALIKSMESLTQRLYAITKLREVELTGPGIMGVIAAMNERYAKRLGFDPEAIKNAHRAETARLKADRGASN